MLRALGSGVGKTIQLDGHSIGQKIQLAEPCTSHATKTIGANVLIIL